MKALVLTAPGSLEIIDIGKPSPAPDEVLVKVSAAALNKRDQWISVGKYPNIQLNIALGSDGVGKVEEVGDRVDEKWIGERVIINPNINWGDDPEVQSKNYSILGMPSHGTFAEYVVVSESKIKKVPDYLNDEAAASFPLGGLTAFRACFHHGKISKDKNVLISGFGGGVAQFAFQYAIAAGANVYVTSGSQKKIEHAMSLGAAGGFNYKEDNWYKNLWQTKGGFDVVIDSAGGDQINHFIKIMRPSGRLVFYGATNGIPSSLDLYRMFWNQITLQGTTMGSDDEFEQMLEFISKHKIEPIVDSVRPFNDITSAFQDITKPDKIGKLVVKF